MDKSCKNSHSREYRPYVCEFLKNGLYFLTLTTHKEPKCTKKTFFFSIDNELVYMNYYSDFGPLNLGMLYRYCMKVNALLKHFTDDGIKVVHYTTRNLRKRTNAAFLIGSYAIIYLQMTPRKAYNILLKERSFDFLPFQDASMGISFYTIDLMDCFEGIYRALQHGFFNFSDFNLDEYETFEKIQYGDLNWIVPEKFIAFCGPAAGSEVYKKPEFYLEYFKMSNVTTVIRLNKKMYNAKSFQDAGITHYELYFMDGGIPPYSIVDEFFRIVESSPGVVAVHCKAGLGRTGSLIGAYLVKHYRLTAREAIAWMRICRPGCVIGHQQSWLEDIQPWLWAKGDYYRLRKYGNADCIPHHNHGIYSIEAKTKHTNKKRTRGSSAVPRSSICSEYIEPLNSAHSNTKSKNVPYRRSETSKEKPDKDAIHIKEDNRMSRNTITPGSRTSARDNTTVNKVSSVGNNDKVKYNRAGPHERHAVESNIEYTQGDELKAIKLLRSEAATRMISKR